MSTPTQSGSPGAAVQACDFCHLPIPFRRRGHTQASEFYCCYGCALAAQITRSRGDAGQVNWMLTRLGLSVFLTMIVMMFSMYLYRQQFVSDEDATAVSQQLGGVMRYLSLLFATPVFLMLGWPVLASAIEGFSRRAFATDALVVLGVGAAFVYSYISTIRDHGAVYYETASVVLVFMTLGRWLEANGKLKAAAAVKSLDALLPDAVTIQRGSQSLTVRPQEIQVGDRLSILAGERIAADGVIEQGHAHLDESLVTGESIPVTRGPGDAVSSGTLNLDGSLCVKATTVCTESTLGRLAALLEDAKRSKCGLERLTDRLAGIFIPITVCLALLALMLGWRRGGVDDAILSSLAVLLIACPCALGIATPMAIWVALGSAAERGALFRTAESIEMLARVRAVCFDKTGTLTTGQTQVKSFLPVTRNTLTESSILERAGALSRASQHVLSRSVNRYAIARLGDDLRSVAVEDVRTVPGRGIVGRHGDAVVALGNAAFMREQSFVTDASTQALMERLQRDSSPFSCVGWGGAVHGVFEFSESLRPEAADALAELRQSGIEVHVLTGDHGGRAAAIEHELGVKTFGALSPHEKVRHIQVMRKECGPVAMVGDGLNDAPAIAEADVGIALGCGADITREHAGLCLLGDDIAGVPWAMDLSRRTVHTIKTNLFWAFAYNIVGMGLALSGRLNPAFAAAAMIVSSLFVVANSLRLGRKQSVRSHGFAAPGGKSDEAPSSHSQVTAPGAVA
jgi:heavy metal translocating P-type ATPase